MEPFWEVSLKYIDQLSIWSGTFVSYFFLISVLITSYEVFVRYMFNAPTTWIFESSIALSAAAILLAGPATMQLRQHISITALYTIIPKKWIRRLIITRSVFALAVCLGFAWASWKFGMTAITTWETSGSGWNAPIPALIKPLVFVSSSLMALQAFRNLLQDIFNPSEFEADNL
jgi:TRAP-type mannitol/chloroaromatic compound transport system permease small subunit